MKRFQYHLQSILELKMKLEEQEKINYGTCRARLHQEQMKLEQLLQRKSEYEEVLRGLLADRLDIRDIRSTEAAIEAMKGKVIRQQTVVKKAEQITEVALYKLNHAIMERKTHEKLREKAFETYIREMDTEERKEIDELVAYQYSTKTKGVN